LDHPEGSGDHASGGSHSNSNHSESEYDSESASDEEDQVNFESKKAKEQYLQEIKETKLREARKILFGDFAVI